MSFVGNFLQTVAGGLSDKYLGTNFVSQQAAQQANEFNAQQAQMNRDWQQQMMQQQNEYNSPLAQMQRARDAGLNPSLLYGNPIQEAASPGGGNAATGVAATGANGSGDLVSSLQQGLFMKKQKELLQAQIDNINKNTEKTGVDIDWTKGQIEVSNSVVIYNNALTDLTRVQKDNIEQDTKLLAKRVEEVNASIEEKNAIVRNMDENTKYLVLKQSLDKAMNEQLIEQIKNEMRWTAEQAKAYVALSTAQISGINSDIALKAAQVELTNEQKNQVVQATSNLKTEGDRISFQYQSDQNYYNQERQMQLDLHVSQIYSNYASTVDSWQGNKIQQNELTKGVRSNLKSFNQRNKH